MKANRRTAGGRASILSRDGWIMVVASGVRTVAYGYLAVSLGVILAQKGVSPGETGFLLTAALVSGALITLALALWAESFGRRRALRLASLLMSATGVVYASTSSFALLLAFAVIGTVSASGRDVGPFQVLDQTVLAGETQDENRTRVFSVYNVVISFAVAAGALLAGLPALLGLNAARGSQVMLAAYALAGLIGFGLYRALSPAVEVPARRGRMRSLGLHSSQRTVLKMSALFGLDAFASGLTVQAIVALWLYIRFGTQLATLGVIFFAMNLLGACSQLLAPRVARRIGLVSTMIWTHAAATLPWLLVPLMPNAWWVVAMLFARSLLSSLDIPARQAYVMGVVSRDERSAAAGLTTIARTAGAALAPALVGVMLVRPVVGVPFLAAGSLRVIYEFGLFAMLRNVPLRADVPSAAGSEQAS